MRITCPLWKRHGSTRLCLNFKSSIKPLRRWLNHVAPASFSPCKFCDNFNRCRCFHGGLAIWFSKQTRHPRSEIWGPTAAKALLSLPVICGRSEIDHDDRSWHRMSSGCLVCCVSFASNSFDFLSRSSHTSNERMFLKFKTTKQKMSSLEDEQQSSLYNNVLMLKSTTFWAHNLFGTKN